MRVAGRGAPPQRAPGRCLDPPRAARSPLRPPPPPTRAPQVHARNKKFDADIDLKEIALRTPGFSGARRRPPPAPAAPPWSEWVELRARPAPPATRPRCSPARTTLPAPHLHSTPAGADLSNLLNEAAILTGRRNKEGISQVRGPGLAGCCRAACTGAGSAPEQLAGNAAPAGRRRLFLLRPPDTNPPLPSAPAPQREIDDSIDRIVAGMEGTPMTDGRSKMLVAYHEVGAGCWGLLGAGRGRAAAARMRCARRHVRPRAAGCLDRQVLLPACLAPRARAPLAHPAPSQHLPRPPPRLQVGHAVCATMTPGHDPVQKVTLIPRGQAKGLTWFIPGAPGVLPAARWPARGAGLRRHACAWAGGPRASPGSSPRRATAARRVQLGARDKRLCEPPARSRAAPAHPPASRPAPVAAAVPRAPAGEDPSLISKQQIFARIVGALGGRAAEEIIFGDAEVTTGASGDLQQVRTAGHAGLGPADAAHALVGAAWVLGGRPTAAADQPTPTPA